MFDQTTNRCLTHKAGLDARRLGDEGVVGVAPYVELLVQVQPLELALRREGETSRHNIPYPSVSTTEARTL